MPKPSVPSLIGAELLDRNFADHLKRCERCRRWDPDRPSATAGELCLAGSVLFKRVAGKVRREITKQRAAA